MRLIAVVKVDRMVAVEVGTIGRPWSITRPERSGVVRGDEPEGIGRLSQAVQVGIFWQRRPQTEVLRLKDKRRACTVE